MLEVCALALRILRIQPVKIRGLNIIRIHLSAMPSSISRHLICILSGLVLLASASPVLSQETKPPINAIATSTLQIAGLKQPAEILIDRWGVPHIYAENQDDVFFAQGFNAARDRLFQIDLWRRRGLGQ